MRTRLDEEIARLAERQYAVFSHAQAVAAHATPEAIKHRVRTGLWVPMLNELYRIPGAPRTRLQTLSGAVLASGPDVCLSHRAATALWDVPGFDLDKVPIELSRVRRAHHRGRVGIVHETMRLRPESVTVRLLLPVTTPARTLIDLGMVVNAKRHERALDNCLAARLVTIPQILHELERTGQWGTGAMRRLLADRGEGYVPTESELEALFLDALIGAGLPLPRKQVVLGDELPIGRIDFVYEEARLVIELDGRRWHEALLDAERDKVRDARLVAEGFRPMRITWLRLKRQRRAAIALIAKAIGLQLPP